MDIQVLGVRVIGVELVKELVRRFPVAEFTDEERQTRRLEKIHALEQRYSTKK